MNPLTRPKISARQKSAPRRLSKKFPAYMEFLIQKDGSVLFSRLVPATKSIVKKLTGTRQEVDNLYCG